MIQKPDSLNREARNFDIVLCRRIRFTQVKSEGVFFALTINPVRVASEVLSSSFDCSNGNKIDFLTFYEFVVSIGIPEKSEISLSDYKSCYYSYPKQVRPDDAYSLLINY